MPLFRRGRRAAATLTALALVLAACGGGDDDDQGAERSTDSTTSSTSTTTTTTTIPAGPIAPFTGDEIDEDSELLEQPAMVVKISNNDQRSLDALIGIDEADIVIEERIEDRATRFFAIFHSSLPEVVGPIRSGRSSDLDLLAPLGTPILVYSGANASVEGQMGALAAEGGVVRVVDDGSRRYHFRDRDFRAPDNLFADLPFVLGEFGDEAGTPEAVLAYLQPADDARPEGEPGPGVTVTGRDIVSFVFVEGEGYVRIQDGKVHVTREDEPLVVDNVVILETSYDPSSFAPGSIDAVTLGTGPATVLIGGEVWEGSWERPDRERGWTLLDADGTELKLDPGQTWISLAPAGTYELDVDAETAALADAVAG